MTQHTGEALVLRTWPFEEADLLVSLYTREQGKVKGVARHAMKSRRRFGGALEPMTYVRARYAEKRGQDLVRLDAFEVLNSPLARPVDYGRTAALQFVAEVLEEAMPEGAPEDAVFRLALSVVDEMQVGKVWMPVTYFALWMNRLMGWMPELGRCSVCGRGLRGEAVWYSPAVDGVTCEADRRQGSVRLPQDSVEEGRRMFHAPVGELAKEEWPRGRVQELRRFAVETLERHLERRLRSARALAVI
jgi:DNA repair protein RecO (recombination protein O)